MAKPICKVPTGHTENLMNTEHWIDPHLGLDGETCRRYHDEGYLFLNRVLTDEGLAGVRRELDRILHERHATIEADQIFSVHQTEKWLLELVSHPRMLDVVERIIGSDIVLWQTVFLCKPPKSGRPIPWHAGPAILEHPRHAGIDLDRPRRSGRRQRHDVRPAGIPPERRIGSSHYLNRILHRSDPPR